MVVCDDITLIVVRQKLAVDIRWRIIEDERVDVCEVKIWV